MYRVMAGMAENRAEMDDFLAQYARQMAEVTPADIMARDLKFAQQGLSIAARRMGEDIIAPIRDGFLEAYRPPCPALTGRSMQNGAGFRAPPRSSASLFFASSFYFSDSMYRMIESISDSVTPRPVGISSPNPSTSFTYGSFIDSRM